MARQDEWSDEELRICVETYFQMVQKSQNGDSLKKTEIRNSVLQNRLKNRSASAYEFRMRNISAVLNELGERFLDGYYPAENVGENVKHKLILLINEYWRRNPSLELPTSDRDHLETRVKSILASAGDTDTPPPEGNLSPQTAVASSKQYVRDPKIVAWVLKQAKGTCEACGKNAPFKDRNGRLFLEVHHVTELANGGPDTVDNAIAVCPNCHRELHFGEERAKLRSRILKNLVQEGRLNRYPRKKRNEEEKA